MERYRILTENEIPRYTGHMSQLAGLKHYRLAGGRSDGVEAVDFRTGSGFDFTVLPGRGMDIAWAHYRGVPVGYMSKTGIVGAPYYESHGMNWLRSFYAGLLTTCGLSNVGGPCEETHDVIGSVHYGLHGRIANTPAEQVSLREQWVDNAYQMSVSGICREGCLHAENLTLLREISAEYGRARLDMTDRIRNNAASPEPVMLMYHINIGHPLLGRESRLIASVNGISPANELAASEKDRYDSFGPPNAVYPERCYLLDINADKRGYAHIALVNDALGLGIAVSYLKSELPYLNEWKMLKEGEYVVGLEPCNCAPIGRAQAQKTKVIEVLEPCRVKETRISIQVLQSPEEIESFQKMVEML